MSEHQYETAKTSGIWVIATAAGVWLLYQGQQLLVPVVFAFVLSGIFRPVVRLMERARVPAPLGGAIVVLGLVGVIAVAGLLISGPVQVWIDQAPSSFERAEVRLKDIRAKFRSATEAATKIERVVDGPTTIESVNPPSGPVMQPTIASQFFGTTVKFLTGLLEVLVLLYLLLSAGDLFFRKLMKLSPRWRDKQMAHDIVLESQNVVKRYVITMFFIAAGQGTVVGITLWLLGMPNPVLWGMFTVVMEFIPYLGAAVMMFLLAIVGFATFDNLGQIMAAPAAYFVISMVQSNVISPYAFGSRLKLNPVAVLLSVLFFWLVWGISGAFLAIPIIATVKLITEQTETLPVLREFLAE